MRWREASSAAFVVAMAAVADQVSRPFGRAGLASPCRERYRDEGAVAMNWMDGVLPRFISIYSGGSGTGGLTEECQGLVAPPPYGVMSRVQSETEMSQTLFAFPRGLKDGGTGDATAPSPDKPPRQASLSGERGLVGEKGGLTALAGRRRGSGQGGSSRAAQ